MFEVLVYMFENYIDTQFRPDEDTLSKELSAAGFDEQDISGAFDWFNQLELMTNQPEVFEKSSVTSARVFLLMMNSKKLPVKAWASFYF